MNKWWVGSEGDGAGPRKREIGDAQYTCLMPLGSCDLSRLPYRVGEGATATDVAGRHRLFACESMQVVPDDMSRRWLMAR